MTIASLPAASISLATTSSLSALRATSATLAPASARPAAIVVPNPYEAPVTIARRPATEKRSADAMVPPVHVILRCYAPAVRPAARAGRRDLRPRGGFYNLQLEHSGHLVGADMQRLGRAAFLAPIVLLVSVLVSVPAGAENGQPVRGKAAP